MHLTDGLNRQRDSLEKMNCIQFQLDSLQSLLCYKDTINKNDVRLDLAEFSKNGLCKIMTYNAQKSFDTVIVKYNVEDNKKHEEYIYVYINSEPKPICNHLIDISPHKTNRKK